MDCPDHSQMQGYHYWMDAIPNLSSQGVKKNISLFGIFMGVTMAITAFS